MAKMSNLAKLLSSLKEVESIKNGKFNKHNNYNIIGGKRTQGPMNPATELKKKSDNIFINDFLSGDNFEYKMLQELEGLYDGDYEQAIEALQIMQRNGVKWEDLAAQGMTPSEAAVAIYEYCEKEVIE